MTKINMADKDEHIPAGTHILQKFRSSISVRLIIMGILCIILMIPSWLVESLIRERETRRGSAMHEISNKWGKDQTIGGPVLTVPYESYIKNEHGHTVNATVFAHFLPDELSVSGDIDTETRYRGIYDVVVYNTRLHIKGRFSFPDMTALGIPDERVLWNDAFLSMGIEDMRGIRETIKLDWNGSELMTEPGIRTCDIFNSGVSAKIDLDRDRKVYDFSLALNVNGSRSLNFLPLGKETDVSVTSDWGNPSFTGSFLPSSREIRANGFNAEWRVLHLNRNFPQQWTGSRPNIQGSFFGATFLLPVDQYQKTMRTAKYALMFIVLTFLAFFMIEVLNKRAIHPVQYLMIGLSLVLFYALLLSVSEHLSFTLAYLLASAATVVLITLYTKGFLESKKHAAAIAGILSGLYGFLYVVLQLQDYSLLLGSTLLFAALSATMYLTRKIDWYSAFSPAARQ